MEMFTKMRRPSTAAEHGMHCHTTTLRAIKVQTWIMRRIMVNWIRVHFVVAS